MNHITNFLSKYESHFVKYPDKKSIHNTYCNWLYLFNVDKYSDNPSIILPENSFKFGYTTTTMMLRLSQYNAGINIYNIECIRCNFPQERETVLKQYIRLKTELNATCGTEYYTNCKPIIKVLFLIIVSLSDNDILEYYKDRNESLLNRIHSTYSIVLTNKSCKLNMNANVINNVSYDKENSVCQYCLKSYSSMYVLLKHQQTAKFCLEMQQKTNADVMHTCTFCSNSFTLKSIYDKHLNVCKEKKKTEEEQKQKSFIDEIQQAKNIMAKYEELNEKYILSLENINRLTEMLHEKDNQISKLMHSLNINNNI